MSETQAMYPSLPRYLQTGYVTLPAYHLINGNWEPNLHFLMYRQGVYNENESFAFRNICFWWK